MRDNPKKNCPDLDQLTRLACRLGASDAAVIPAREISVEVGYAHSRAFAGGSCKQLFCRDHQRCRVLAEGGACRHPDRARPSMSGFGINVLKLNQSAGWGMDKITRDTDPTAVPMGAVSGLVLI